MVVYFYLVVQETIKDGWVVSLVQDGQVVASDIELQDPLNEAQKETVRWYLEDFLTVSPFLVDKATEAEDLLLEYPKFLSKRLNLATLFLSNLRWDRLETDSHVIELVICQGIEACDGDSIQALFWETLEAPSLWNSRVQVVVQRSLKDNIPLDSMRRHPLFDGEGRRAPCTSTMTTTPDTTKEAVPKTLFNMLLVVARDLRRNRASLRQDVVPGLILDLLLEIKRQLHNRPVQLNIEVVRPGTLSAFQRHLEEREQEHGPNYFDAVHFDLHGKIGTRKGRGTKTAILYFNREQPQDEQDDKDTEPIAAVKVARIVQKYRIPLVILNACQSATANGGANASMAHHFLKRGVQSVVGMSFKVSHDAVAIFLYNFYYALLIHGMPVSTSVGLARMATRVNMKRETRYRLERKLRDGCVPVHYGETPSPSYGHGNVDMDKMYFAKLNTLLADETKPYIENRYGRDFDLLRLERLLSHHNIVYLHSLAGVGKSILVHKAMQIWRKTNHMDLTLSLDLEYGAEFSYNDLITEIIHDIERASSESESEHCKRVLSNIKFPETADLIDSKAEEFIIEAIKKLNTTLIIDHLEIFPIKPLPSHISDTDAGPILPFIRQLIQLARDPSRDRRFQIIFTSCRADPIMLESALGYDFGPYRYALSPLDLPDAIEFVTQQCSSEAPMWTSTDIDYIESTVTLLQCIPEALDLVVQTRYHEPWPEFYEKLRQGLFASIDELDPELEALKYFQHLSITPPYLYFMLGLLGTFWKVAPPLHSLLSIFDAIAPAPIKQLMDSHRQDNLLFMNLSFNKVVVNRGYITESADGSSLYIHPMYTIVAQAHLEKYLGLATRVTLATNVSQALEVYTFKSAISVSVNLWEPNYLTVLRACIKEVPVDMWPLAFMNACYTGCVKHIPRAARRTIYTLHFDLLHTLTFKLPLLDDKRDYIAFFAFTLLHFAMNGINPDEATQQRLLTLAEQGITKVLPSYSSMENADATLVSTYNGICLVAWILGLISAAKFDVFSQRVQDLRQVTSVFQVSNDELQTFFRRAQTADVNSTGSSTALMGDVKVWLKGCSYIFDILEAQAQRQAEPKSPSLPDDQVEEVPRSTRRAAPRTSQVAQLKASLDSISPYQHRHETVDEKLQWLAYCQEMTLLFEATKANIGYPTENNNHTRHIEQIDDIQEDGDWFSICTEQMKLVFIFVSSQQLQTAKAHLAAIQAVLSRADVPQELIQAANQCHSRINIAWLTTMCQETLFPNTWTETILSMVRTTMERDHDTTLTQEWMVYLSRHHQPETLLLKQALTIMEQREFIKALGLLYQLDLRFDVILGQYPQAKADIRRYLQGMILGAKCHSIMQAVYKLALNDVEGAKASISTHVTVLTELAEDDLEAFVCGLRLVVAKHEFVTCRIDVLAGSSMPTTPLKREKFRGILRKFQDGNFQALCDLDIVIETRLTVLQWLIEDAEEMKWWVKALAYCKDYEEHAPLSLQQEVATKGAIFRVQERSRWKRVLAAIDKAERARRFAHCLRIVQHMQGLMRWSKSLQGIPRSEILLFTDKMFDALKAAYTQRCVMCARWITQRGSERKVGARGTAMPLLQYFQKRRVVGRYRRHRATTYAPKQDSRSLERARGRRHRCDSIREVFRKPPFGCRHHCRGNYCFTSK